VIHAATMSGFLQALWDVVMWLLVVTAEIFVIALIIAPRFVVRKLRSFLGAPVRHAERVLGPSSARAGPAQAPREGT
jgi:hypothetical protein